MTSRPTLKRQAMSTALSGAWMRLAVLLEESSARSAALEISKHFSEVADGIAVARNTKGPAPQR